MMQMEVSSCFVSYAKLTAGTVVIEVAITIRKITLILDKINLKLIEVNLISREKLIGRESGIKDALTISDNYNLRI